MGTIIFYTVTLTMQFDQFFANFNLADNFRTVSARALIFYMSIPFDKTVGTIIFVTVTLTLEFDPFFTTLTLLITLE